MLSIHIAKLKRPGAWIICWIALGTFSQFRSAAAAITDANWSTLGSGMNNTVHALAVSGTNLYAGGKFTSAGGVSANFIAKWNGQNWSPLGSGMNGYVYALAVSGTNLYAGGEFTSAGGTATNHIARWNGSSWLPFANGLSGYYVAAILASGTDLYIGGSFSSPSGSIGKWNGFSWSSLAIGNSGMNNTVYSLAMFSGSLHAGGDFTSASGTTVNHIARWNGFGWSALSSGMGFGDGTSVYALTTLGTKLFAGGAFTTAGSGTGNSSTSISMWDGSSWAHADWLAGGTYLYPTVSALVVAGTNLYAGGDFTSAGSLSNRIARWNGNVWTSLGSGVNGTVRALATSGTELFVGGDFTTAGKKSASYIARVYVATPPALSITRSAGDVVVSWPSANAATFFLEAAPSLAVSASWISNTATVNNDGTNSWVTIPADTSQQFFRLRKP